MATLIKQTCLKDILERSSNCLNKIGSVGDVIFSYKDFFSYVKFESIKLKQQGVKSNENVLILMDDNFKRLIAFWSCIYIGATPCFIPVNKCQFLENKDYFINCLNNPYIFTEKKISNLSRQILYDSWNLKLKQNSSPDHQYNKQNEKIIIFSSGTTGLPKAVTYTGQQLLNNALSIQKRNGYTSSDKLFSWLPVNHIFGLELHIIAMLVRASQLYSDIDEFIINPEIWFEQISKNQITITTSTMMGLQVCIAMRERLGNYNLSSLKQLIIGGEAINCDAVNQFYNCFSSNGISIDTINVGYGLTECGIISIGKFKEKKLKRQPQNIGEKVQISNKETDITVVNLGKPYDCYKVVIKGNNQALKEKVYGEVCIESIVSANKIDGTLNREVNTGDLGFLLDGQLFICGRNKEVLILNGQNINLNVVNDFITHRFGIESFIVRDTVTIFDKGIIIFILSSSIKNNNLNLNDIRKIILKKFQIGTVKIKIVDRFDLLESGKINKKKMIERYENILFKDK